MQIDEYSSFLDLDTGRVETVSADLLCEAEESEDEDEDEEEEDRDLPDGERAEWEIAKKIVSTGRFQKLPTKYEVHEWNIMQNFSSSVKPDKIREDLLDAIPAPARSGTSKPLFGGMASKRRGLHSARRPFDRSRSTGAKRMALLGVDEFRHKLALACARQKP